MVSVLLVLGSRTGFVESLLPSSVSDESNSPSTSPPELPPVPAEYTFPFKLEKNIQEVLLVCLKKNIIGYPQKIVIFNT